MYKIDEDLRTAFEQEITKGLTEKAIESLQKDLRKVTDSFEDDFLWNLKDNLAYNLTAYVADMAERAVEQMLAGNDDQMRRYLSCDKRDLEDQVKSLVEQVNKANAEKEWERLQNARLD